MKTMAITLFFAILSAYSAELASAQNLAEVLSELKSQIEQIEKQVDGNSIPQGTIVMWSGAINDIPKGWLLCDGTKGTPNLSNRFVMGTAATESNAPRTGGGEVVLENENLPLHLHSINHGHGHTLSVSPPEHAHSSSRTRTDIVGTSYERGKLAKGDERGLWTGDSIPTGKTELKIKGGIRKFEGESSDSGRKTPVPIKIIPSYYKLAFIMKGSE